MEQRAKENALHTLPGAEYLDCTEQRVGLDSERRKRLSVLRPHSRIVAIVGQSCLVTLSLALGFVLCEVMVRVFVSQPINPRYVHDSGFGIRDNQPYIRAHHSSPGEYEINISTNSDGLRGTTNYRYTPSAGTRRIAMLGDSFVFGYGCNDDQVVSAVLERALNDTAGAGRKWEVLNFGVSGYGQAEELILYRNKTRRYRPDTVILFYFDNDIGNNVIADMFRLGLDGQIKSTGKTFLPGTVAQQWMYDVPFLRGLLVNSQALSLIRNRLSVVVQQHLLDRAGLKGYEDGTTSGVALTRALLMRLQREVQNDGAKFIVVIVPNNDNPTTTNFPFTPDEWQKLGMSVVDGRTFVDRSDYYVRDGHWKPSAHRKAATALMPMLLEMVPRTFGSDGYQSAPVPGKHGENQ